MSETQAGIIQKNNYAPAGAYFLPSVNTDTSSSPLLEEDLLESVFYHSFVLVLGLFCLLESNSYKSLGFLVKPEQLPVDNRIKYNIGYKG